MIFFFFSLHKSPFFFSHHLSLSVLLFLYFFFFCPLFSSFSASPSSLHFTDEHKPSLSLFTPLANAKQLISDF